MDAGGNEGDIVSSKITIRVETRNTRDPLSKQCNNFTSLAVIHPNV